MLSRLEDPLFWLAWVPNLIFALTMHECAHAWMAGKLGDDTARRAGRVTLNPLAHLDLFGTLMILFGPFGWAKPVPVNPSNFRHPRRDDLLVAAAGPVCNLCLALVFGVGVRVMVAIGAVGNALQFCWIGVLLGCSLALFNAIPVAPLDGSHILRSLLPRAAREKYDDFSKIAPFILMGLLVFGDRPEIKPIWDAFLYLVNRLMGLITGL